MTALEKLAEIIRIGLPDNCAGLDQQAKDAISGVFGERYRKGSEYALRTPLALKEDNVPFAGLVHSSSPTSGVYGGMSLIWFPISADDAGPARSLLTLSAEQGGCLPIR